MKEMKILVKFPTRGRRERFFNTLDLFYSMANRPELLEVRVTMDEDDAEMNHPEVLARLREYPRLSVYLGTSLSKVHAMNRDVGPLDWDILILAADDTVPIHKGYDDVIREAMARHHPDTDGVLWFNDGNRDDLNTQVIIGRRCYERFGYLYHPAYESLYCDKEFTIVGNKMKHQTYSGQVIIRHEHPDYGYDTHDQLYAWNDQRKYRDMVTFLRRQSMNFGIGSPLANQASRLFWEVKWFFHRLRRGHLFMKS